MTDVRVSRVNGAYGVPRSVVVASRDADGPSWLQGAPSSQTQQPTHPWALLGRQCRPRESEKLRRPRRREELVLNLSRASLDLSSWFQVVASQDLLTRV